MVPEPKRRKQKRKLVATQIRLDEENFEDFQEYCQERELSMSARIRQMVDADLAARRTGREPAHDGRC